MNRKKIYHWGFWVPAVVLYTMFFLLPVILNFAYSFTNWNALKMTHETARWVGLKNYIRIFSSAELSLVIVRTIYFGFVTTVFKNLCGLLLALLLNSQIRTRNFLRAVFFLPSILSPLIIGLMFGTIFMTKGPFNQLLSLIGLEKLVKPWFTTIGTAFPMTMVVEVWRQTGFIMVIYLAGLQLIDSTYYEAAEIDGANAFCKFFSITLPRLLPSISINLLLCLSQGLKAFDIIFVLTNGGPNGTSEVLSTMIFHEYGKKLYGMSAAYGVVMFIICAIFGLISMRLTNRNLDE